MIQDIAQIISAVVVIATLVAKLTPTPKDDKAVSKVSSIILKILKFLPTIGVNPSTKKLEESYNKLKNK